MLCEFLFFSLQLPHLCNMKQKVHQNAAFGCFVLIHFYDIVSFTAATTITRIPSSLSATLHSFWLAIFSPHPLQNRKRHDITWPEEPKWSFGWWTSLVLPTMKQNNFTRRCAVTLGMKKISVDQLTKAVGITKCSFYKFYESKERRFFGCHDGVGTDSHSFP